jgi:hypothetical protein
MEESYHVGDMPDMPCELFGVTGTPHTVIIDTKGIVAFIGNPFEIDLESAIFGLLSPNPVTISLHHQSDAHSGYKYPKIDHDDLAFRLMDSAKIERDI